MSTFALKYLQYDVSVAALAVFIGNGLAPTRVTPDINIILTSYLYFIILLQYSTLLTIRNSWERAKNSIYGGLERVRILSREKYINNSN